MARGRTNKASTTQKKLTGGDKPGVHRVRTKVKFFRPTTKTQMKKPRVLRNIGSHTRNLEKQDGELQLANVLLEPSASDKDITNMEKRNTITFMVNPRANKNLIRAAFKKRFNYKAKKVNTLHTMRGKKKAYIRLENDVKAIELASKIGIV